MKRLICFLFGHNIVIRDWYPNDKITKVTCLRCHKIINEYKNPLYQKK